MSTRAVPWRVLAIVGLLQGCGGSPAPDAGATAPPIVAAGVSIVEQQPTSLTIELTDRRGSTKKLTFGRATAGAAWQSPERATAMPGVIFGNAAPAFATPAQLREGGIAPKQAIRPFSAEIADRPADDVTIFRLYGGELAIGLWKAGVITELWHIGPLVETLLSGSGATACERLLDLCARTVAIETAGEVPVMLPNPNINACIAAADGCAAQREQACGSLFEACDLCFREPEACGESWLEELQENACAAHTNTCHRPTSGRDDPTLVVLRALRDRLEAVIEDGKGG